jgi:hypothetical protein
VIAKLLLAVALVAVPVSASAPAPDALYVNVPAVHQVSCLDGLGTAFEADGHMVSVEHVTSLHGCFIDRAAVKATPEAGLDFSIIDLPAKGLRINCDGFKRGEMYYAVGYAYGNPVQRMIVLIGTGQHDEGNGEAILLGWPSVIPGMSGGPIINNKAEVVGSVNMYLPGFPFSLSRELKDTSLCRS